MDFRDYAVALTPAWLRQPKGEAFMRGMGDVRDWMTDRLRQSVLARFFGYATRDGLNYGGVDRQLVRAPLDTDAQYAARLREAWNVWPWAGTPFGVLSEAKASGYPSVTLVISLGKVFRLNVVGELESTSGALLSFSVPFWNTFAAILDALPAHWGGVVPAEYSDEANRLRGILNRWKPAHAILDKIVVLNGGIVWGYPETREWGDVGINWGNSTTVVWSGS